MILEFITKKKIQFNIKDIWKIFDITKYFTKYEYKKTIGILDIKNIILMGKRIKILEKILFNDNS